MTIMISRRAALIALLTTFVGCVDRTDISTDPTALEICEDVTPRDVESSLLAALLGDAELGHTCQVSSSADPGWSRACGAGSLGPVHQFLLEMVDPLAFEVCRVDPDPFPEPPEPADPNDPIAPTPYPPPVPPTPENTTEEPVWTGTGDVNLDVPSGPRIALPGAPASSIPSDRFTAAPQPPAPKIKWPPDPAQSVLIGEDRYVIGRSRDANTGKFGECEITIDNKSGKEMRLRFPKLDQANGADRIANTRKYFFEPFKADKSLNYDVGQDVTVPAGKSVTVKTWGLTVASLRNNNGAADIALEIVVPVNMLANSAQPTDQVIQASMKADPADWLKKTITINDK